MSKLSEIRGADALDILADIMDPLSEILSDPVIVKVARTGNRIQFVNKVIKTHKEHVLLILAILNQEDPATYSPNVVEIISGIINLLNEPGISEVFTLQGQIEDGSASGSATESTEETETE